MSKDREEKVPEMPFYEDLIEDFCNTYQPTVLGPDSIDLDRRQLRAFFNAEQPPFSVGDPLPQYLQKLYDLGFADVDSPYSHGRVMPVRLKEIPTAEELTE